MAYCNQGCCGLTCDQFVPRCLSKMTFLCTNAAFQPELPQRKPTRHNFVFSVGSLFALCSRYTWMTELFREYRPSYSDILPLESLRGHSSGSSGATVKRSLSRISRYRSHKAKAFRHGDQLQAHRLSLKEILHSDARFSNSSAGWLSRGTFSAEIRCTYSRWEAVFRSPCQG